MSIRLRNDGWLTWHSKLYGVLWRLAEFVFVSNQLQVYTGLRVLVLRWFGATIGSDCVLPPFRVRFPYNLSIGDRCWIGEQVSIYNPAKLTIGSDSALNQECLIVTGSHDLATMDETVSPITIGTAVWLSSRTIIISDSAGITIGDGVVVTPGSVISRSLPGSTDGARTIYGGNPVRKLRRLDQEQTQYAAGQSIN